jgi:hypothetical protein
MVRIPENDSEARSLFATTLTGVILWTFVSGVVQIVLSIDPKGIHPEVMVQLFSQRPFVALVCMGLIFGLSVSLAFILGGAVRSQLAVIGGPLLVGFILGSFQGYLIGTEVWGYVQSGIPLQVLPMRLFIGSWIGLIIVIPTILLSIGIRKGFGIFLPEYYR